MLPFTFGTSIVACASVVTASVVSSFFPSIPLEDITTRTIIIAIMIAAAIPIPTHFITPLSFSLSSSSMSTMSCSLSAASLALSVSTSFVSVPSVFSAPFTVTAPANADGS